MPELVYMALMEASFSAWAVQLVSVLNTEESSLLLMEPPQAVLLPEPERRVHVPKHW
jgi:hypothetical protein